MKIWNKMPNKWRVIGGIFIGVFALLILLAATPIFSPTVPVEACGYGGSPNGGGDLFQRLIEWLSSIL